MCTTTNIVAIIAIAVIICTYLYEDDKHKKNKSYAKAFELRESVTNRCNCKGDQDCLLGCRLAGPSTAGCVKDCGNDVVCESACGYGLMQINEVNFSSPPYFEQKLSKF